MKSSHHSSAGDMKHRFSFFSTAADAAAAAGLSPRAPSCRHRQLCQPPSLSLPAQKSAPPPRPTSPPPPVVDHPNRKLFSLKWHKLMVVKQIEWNSPWACRRQSWQTRSQCTLPPWHWSPARWNGMARNWMTRSQSPSCNATSEVIKKMKTAKGWGLDWWVLVCTSLLDAKCDCQCWFHFPLLWIVMTRLLLVLENKLPILPLSFREVFFPQQPNWAICVWAKSFKYSGEADEIHMCWYLIPSAAELGAGIWFLALRTEEKSRWNFHPEQMN